MRTTTKQMKARIPLLLTGVLLLGAGGNARADTAYSYARDFEDGVNPFAFYAQSTAPTINFNNVTTSTAFDGTKSYLLDVTFAGTGPQYLYYKINGVPNKYLENNLTLTARVKVRRIPAAGQSSCYSSFYFGVEYTLYPSSVFLAGCSPIGDTVINDNTSGSGWQAVSSDMVAWSKRLVNTALFSTYQPWDNTSQITSSNANKLLLMLYGNPGERIQVYIDNLSLTGMLPDSSFTTTLSGYWTCYTNWCQAKIGAYQSAYTTAVNTRDNITPSTGFETTCWNMANSLLTNLVSQYGTNLANITSPLKVVDYNKLEWALNQAQGILDGITQNRNGTITRTNHLLYTLPTTNTIAIRTAIDNATNPYIYGYINNQVSVTVAPDEYRAIPLAVQSVYADLTNLTVASTNLTDGLRTIPASQIDVRIVKWWYQSGTDLSGGGNYYVPEVMLKDDTLITTSGGENYAKLNGTQTQISHRGAYLSNTISGFPIIDNVTLQPVTISSSKVRIYWLTVRAPSQGTGCPQLVSGTYKGSLQLKTGSTIVGNYPFTVTVLPVTFAVSPVTQGIYYRSVLTSGNVGSISGIDNVTSHLNRTTAQYVAELSDLVAHGVTSPTMYQSYSDNTLIDSALSYRQNAGMTGPLYFIGNYSLNNPFSYDPAFLTNVTSYTQTIVSHASTYGFGPVYNYGRDEPSETQVLSEYDVWKATQSGGGKVWQASPLGETQLTYPANKRMELRFDATSGSLADDTSGYVNWSSNIILSDNNYGRLVDFADNVSCWVTGKIGNALSFNGLNNRVHVTESPDVIYTNTGGTSELTLSAWINRDATDTDASYILSKPWDAGGSYNYYLALDGSGHPMIHIGGATFWDYTVTTSTVTSGWKNLAMTVDGGRNVTLYLNGNSIYSGTHSVTNWSITNSHYSLCIGSKFPYTPPWAGLTSFSFKGVIDEVQVFARCLRSAEISQMYNDGSSGLRPRVGDLRDLGVVPGTPSATEAAQVHAVSGHRVYSYDNPFVAAEDPGWFRKNYGLSLWCFGYDGACDYVYQVSNGHIYDDFDTATQRDEVMAYPTVNGVLDTIQWEGYREGVNDLRYLKMLQDMIDNTSSSQTRTDAINYLNSLSVSDTIKYLNLDAIRSQMTAYLNNLTGQVAHWRLDNSSGTMAVNSIGSAGNGDLIDFDNTNSCWTTGKIGNALTFDDNNSRVVIPSCTDITYQGGNMTVSVWIYCNNDTTGGYIVSRPRNSVGDYNYRIGLDSSRRPVITIGGNGLWLGYATFSVTNNGWTNLVLTVDSGRNVNLYMNGGASTYTGVHTITNWTPAGGVDSRYDRLLLGSVFPYTAPWVGKADFTFKGMIDEVMIFNRLLSTAEIQQIYNNGN